MEMTEKDCLRNGDWKRIKYYPVSVEKLQQASMREAAYLIAPVNIGEDYEYFDEVKHLLIMPEPRKTLEEIEQELNEKFDKLLVKTKKNFDMSRLGAEYRYNQFCKQQEDDFEYARENGKFRKNIIINYSALKGSEIKINSDICSSNFAINSMSNSAGYYAVGTFRYYLDKKPNRIVRYFSKLLLNLEWKST